jgi:hypothetical protein
LLDPIVRLCQGLKYPGAASNQEAAVNLDSQPTLGFVIGGLYSRQSDVHARFGGQEQGGISTPKRYPYIFAFTGEVGRSHGYHDFWDEDGLFHYFGEGQSGDMTYRAGNLAILRHQNIGKRLFVFQMLGHGQPYRFLGEFNLVNATEQTGTSSKSEKLRTVIVFILRPVIGPGDMDETSGQLANRVAEQYPLGPASRAAVVQVRTQQWLFRRRVADLEKGCRLTGVSDLRFLRASHIKPWSRCGNDSEKLDGNNGLLLCPQADLLFDRGWITFNTGGALELSGDLPNEVTNRIGLDLIPGRKCGKFRPEQEAYLDFHRTNIYRRRYAEMADPLGDLQLD